MSIPNVQYIAEIKHVREVLLLGAANLEFWRARLKNENLYPLDVNGKAQVAISATQLKWMGLPSRELVISITVCKHANINAPAGAYLIHAFNASRLLAWLERTFFQTPYYPGKIDVESRVPASITLDDDNQSIFRAQMSSVPERLRSADEIWQDAIFLPKQAAEPGNVFFAKLGGFTEAYPFLPAIDLFDLKPSRRAPVFEWLIKSNFAPQEWRIRQDATHARSKTYKRIENS